YDAAGSLVLGRKGSGAPLSGSSCIGILNSARGIKMSTINVNENLAAHVAILNLLNRYTDAVNQRDWAELESVFADDGIWDMGGEELGPMAMHFEGARKIAEGIAASVSTTELCVQTNHAAVV